MGTKYYSFEVELTGGFRKIGYGKVEDWSTPERAFGRWADVNAIIEIAWSERQYGNFLIPKREGDNTHFEVFDDRPSDFRATYFRIFFNGASVLKEKVLFPIDTADSDISMELENWALKNLEVSTKITEISREDYEHHINKKNR